MNRWSSLVCNIAAMPIAACAARGTSAGGLDAGEVEPAMVGTVYEEGRVFVQTYCSPCHWKGGKHPKQPVAYPAFQVDTYDEWATGTTIVPAVLDKWKPDGIVMPPPEAPAFPPDDQRMLILDWVHRGSPNTASGT